MKLFAFFLFLFLFPAQAAHAAQIEPDPDFSLDLPDGWETTRGPFSKVPQSVSAILECVDGDPGMPLLMAGWKADPGGALAGFCVSYRRSGGGKTLNLLKATRGKERDDAFGSFADIFASNIQSGYKRRNMVVEDMAADLLSAAENVIMVLDGKVRASGKVYMRSDTVILHGDAILNVSTIYDVSASDLLGKELDALPVSAQWKK